MGSKVGSGRIRPVIGAGTPTAGPASFGRPVIDVGQLGGGAAAQQWPLIGLDGPQLGLVHGLPVVLQDSTCVTGVRVPGPGPVADSVSLQASDEGPLPGAFGVPADR